MVSAAAHETSGSRSHGPTEQMGTDPSGPHCLRKRRKPGCLIGTAVSKHAALVIRSVESAPTNGTHSAKGSTTP